MNFKIPTLTLAAFITFYLIGNRNEGVPPFYMVKPVDLNRSQVSSGSKKSKIITEMKKMMSFVERAGREANVWENNMTNWTVDKTTRLYSSIFNRFRIPPKKGKLRFEALTWKTYLNIVVNNKNRLVGDPS